MTAGPARIIVQTPRGTSLGAIALLMLAADSDGELEGVLQSLTGRPAARPGSAPVRRLADVDSGLAARVSPTSAVLSPHGSPVVIERLCAAARRAGAVDAAADDPRLRYPEAQGDLLRACVLETVARSASPRIAGVLAAQAHAWRVAAPLVSDARAEQLDRLLEPPVVAAIGPANVGKSTLTNALAGRSVSIVSSAPGTTRDRVGVSLVLDGVAVRWLDTPGRRRGAGDAERRALGLADEAVRAADLVLSCGDGEVGFLPEAEAARLAGAGAPVLRVGLRTDAHAIDAGSCDAAVSARSGAGLEGLASLVRESLVPDAACGPDRRWRFHPALGA